MAGRGVSEVRRQVAAKWAAFEYGKQEEKAEVIDLTLSNDEDEGEKAKEAEPGSSGDFKLFKSDLYDTKTESAHFITLKDIFTDERLVKTVLFSYQYELDFLLSHFIPDRIKSIQMVAQQGTVVPISLSKLLVFEDKIDLLNISMPPYTAHHSKMIINFYEDNTVKIFLPSANFTYYETHLPQQVCWCSPRLVQTVSPRKLELKTFQTQLVDYLRSYRDKRLSKDLVTVISCIDFTPLQNVQFAFSSPSKTTVSGLQQLVDLTKLNRIKSSERNSTHHFLCQTSTIGGSLARKASKNLFTHLLIPTVSGISGDRIEPLETQQALSLFHTHNIVPYILYPTVEEIRTSPSGWKCGGWFHFHRQRDPRQYKVLLKDFRAFYKQDGENLSKERRGTPLHSKFYMKSTTKPNATGSAFKTLDWCLYTSANLSFNAWGSLKGRPRNYEVGVFYSSSVDNSILECESFVDSIYKRGNTLGENLVTEPNTTIRRISVPFTMQLQEYDVNEDECFCIAEAYNMRDSVGELYNSG